MNKYELALVVSAKIEDDARTATVEKAKEYITRAGGAVTEVEEWGKKRLAYEIQKMNEAFYYFIQFDAESNVPALVEQDVRIMDNVLRFTRDDPASFSNTARFRDTVGDAARVRTDDHAGIHVH